MSRFTAVSFSHAGLNPRDTSDRLSLPIPKVYLPFSCLLCSSLALFSPGLEEALFLVFSRPETLSADVSLILSSVSSARHGLYLCAQNFLPNPRRPQDTESLMKPWGVCASIICEPLITTYLTRELRANSWPPIRWGRISAKCLSHV